MSRVLSEAYYGRPLVDPYARPPLVGQFFDSTASRPILPDVQFRVPMESRRDVDKVKEALDLDGVHGVNCDLQSQTVTVSGNVPYHRLLKKLKHVKRKAKLLSFASPDSPFSPSYGHEIYHDRPYGTSYGSSAYGRIPIRAPLSPPRQHSSSYVAHSFERPYYEDYEDYRPYNRYSGF